MPRTTLSRLLAICVSAGLSAAVPAAGAARAAPARGADCRHPFQVNYVRGRVVGDTRLIYVQVLRQGSRYTISWHALATARFCSISILEAKGQRLFSSNPSSKFLYTDYTRDHTNGIKSLTATARRG